MLELETFLLPAANLGFLIALRIVTNFPNFLFCLQPCSCFCNHASLSRAQEQIHRSTLRIVLAKWRIAIALGARAQFMMRRLEAARVRPVPRPVPTAVLCPLSSVLCALPLFPSALCLLSSALCPLPSALCLCLPGFFRECISDCAFSHISFSHSSCPFLRRANARRLHYRGPNLSCRPSPCPPHLLTPRLRQRLLRPLLPQPLLRPTAATHRRALTKIVTATKTSTRPTRVVPVVAVVVPLGVPSRPRPRRPVHPCRPHAEKHPVLPLPLLVPLVTLPVAQRTVFRV
jgi:hypothetical protein